MANNLVVQLLLKTGTFSTDLKTARGQVQNFQKGCQTAGKSLDAFGKAIGIDVGMLTKFGGAVGIAVAAGKGLKAVIDSNQKSADFFQSAMYSAKTAVDELAYSIGTFDFSNFQDGLSGLIRRAREAAAAIDQLGNTLMSYNVIQAKARLSISQAKAIINDPNSTKEQVEEAKKVMKESMDQMRQSASVLLDDYKTALIAEVNAKGAKITGEGAIDILDMWLTADAMGNREAIKGKADSDYDTYLEELNRLQKRFTTTTTIQSITGAYTMSKLNDTDPAYQSELAALNKQYESAIAYNVLLNKYSDEQLQKLGQQRVAMIQTEQTLADMTTQMERVENKTTGTTTATQKAAEAIKGSLTDWQKMAQEAQKNRDASVYMSDAWKSANAQLEEALKNIEKITAAMERAKTESKYGTDILTPITGQKLTGQVENSRSDNLAGVNKHTIEDLEAMVAVYEKLNKKLTEGDPLLAHYNQRIKELRQEIERLKQYGVWTPPTPPDEDAEKWDKFTNAMYSSANAVSSISDTFQSGMKVTTASVLKMVSQTLPAISTLIDAYVVLAGVEATSKAVTTSKHWIEAIAAVAALGAAVATALSMANSNKSKFAQGGIVGGNSFTGDRVTAQVNSGEMILNKAQQARLFKIANGGATGGNQVEFHISGTELVGVLNNQNRKNNLIR